MTRRCRPAARALAVGLVMASGLACRDQTLTAAHEETPAVAARAFWATYQEATARRMASDCAGAVPLYRQALDQRPDHEDTLYYLGNCLADLGAYVEALESYDRLARLNPAGSSRAQVQAALLHTSLRPGAPFDLENAERLLRQALEVDPDSAARLGLAEVRLLRGDVDAARRLLIEMDADSPMSVPEPFLLGYLAYRAEGREAARPHFAAAVSRLCPPEAVSRWSEEGDAKSAPERRWQALARQSVFGASWLAIRGDAGAGCRAVVGDAGDAAAYPRAHADLARVYDDLHGAIEAARARARPPSAVRSGRAP